jgi:hypothetical protein
MHGMVAFVCHVGVEIEFLSSLSWNTQIVEKKHMCGASGLASPFSRPMVIKGEPYIMLAWLWWAGGGGGRGRGTWMLSYVATCMA